MVTKEVRALNKRAMPLVSHRIAYTMHSHIMRAKQMIDSRLRLSVRRRGGQPRWRNMHFRECNYMCVLVATMPVYACPRNRVCNQSSQRYVYIDVRNIAPILSYASETDNGDVHYNHYERSPQAAATILNLLVCYFCDSRIRSRCNVRVYVWFSLIQCLAEYNCDWFFFSVGISENKKNCLGEMAYLVGVGAGM